MSYLSQPVCPNSVNFDECYKDKIKTALNNFNTAFACYQGKCQNGCATKMGSGCTFAEVVQPSYTILMKTIDEVLSKMKPIDLVNYDVSMNKMKTDYQEVVELRAYLDTKIAEINQTYTTDNGIPNIFQKQYDYTVYIAGGWTLLAITLFYLAVLKNSS